jgi:hypothetical protein
MGNEGSLGLFKVGGLLFGRGTSAIVTYITTAPVNGTSGTLAGKAGFGSIIISTLTGLGYQNQNTKASPTWVAVFGAQATQSVEADLSAAQLTTLNSVPVAIAAAPGAGKIRLFESLLFSFTFNSVQFTGGGAVQLQYHGASTNLMSSTIAAALITGNANGTRQFIPAATASGIVGVTNAALELAAATADFAAGDSTAKAFLKYRDITL